MTFLFWLGVFSTAIYLLIALDLLMGNRSVCMLRNIDHVPPPEVPRISVIVAARNEERNIREALDSLLGQNYPDMEVIVVDDRSEDGTGAVLDRIAEKRPDLEVIHLSSLPDGWLGKNNALRCGAGMATGDILLFTDADIFMESTVLSRAVRYLQENALAHLAVTPRMTMPGIFLPMFGLSFIYYFSILARPWKAGDPRSRRHIGIGAFNLVRTEAYMAAGGHESIRLRPDDDMMLGKILKQHGFRSVVAYGPEFLSVEWYASVGEAVRGLEKNSFAACSYSVFLALSGLAVILMGCVFPYIAVFVTDGVSSTIYSILIILQILMVADCARFHGLQPWHALGLAPCTLLLSWIILRSAVLCLLRGGIYWRGTFYPLEELKRNKV